MPPRKRTLLTVLLVLGLFGPALLAGPASARTIWNIAGIGSACSTPPSCGDGGPATEAQLSYPLGIALAADGSVYIADWGDNEIRRLSPTGTITVIAGDGTACIKPKSCGDGGPATDAQLGFPTGVAVDRAGNVYIADTTDNEVRKVSPAGRITRFAGTGTACAQPPTCGDGGSATAAQLSAPAGVAVDKAGDVFIADTGDNEIREVSTASKISRVAGNGSACTAAPSCGDGAAATSAQLYAPQGLALSASGNLYIADDGDNEIREVSSATGTISRIAGNGKLCSTPPSCGNGGPATSAQLGLPDGVAVDRAGRVLIADDGDNQVREVSTSGKIVAIAGTGSSCAQASACGNGGSATSAQLNYPDALAIDPGGNVYVSDTGDQELRWLSARSPALIATSAAKVPVLAFESAVSKAAVTVRFALGTAAAVSLSVSAAGRPATVVARRSAAGGFGELSWDRHFGPDKAPRGRYKLTVTATIGGHGAASSVSVKL